MPSPLQGIFSIANLALGASRLEEWDRVATVSIEMNRCRTCVAFFFPGGQTGQARLGRRADAERHLGEGPRHLSDLWRQDQAESGLRRYLCDGKIGIWQRSSRPIPFNRASQMIRVAKRSRTTTLTFMIM